MIYTIEDGMCVRGEINSQVEIWDSLVIFHNYFIIFRRFLLQFYLV